MEGIFGAVVILAIYVLPTLVAWRRRHASVLAIALMNIVLGWTLLFWLWAMIWSLNGNVRTASAR